MKTTTQYYYEDSTQAVGGLTGLFWLALASLVIIGALAPLTFWEKLATAVFIAACLCLMFWGRVRKVVVTVENDSHQPTARALKGV